MKDPKYVQVIVCGKSGEGVSFVSKILGYACALSGKHCTVSPSIEPRVRGGLVYSDIIVSTDEIGCPKVTRADMLIAFSQSPYELFVKKSTKKETAVFYDPANVTPDRTAGIKHYAIPCVEKSAKELKTDKISNIVFLSAIIRLTKIASVDSLNKAIKANLKEDQLSINLKALELGTRLARKIKYP